MGSGKIGRVKPFDGPTALALPRLDAYLHASGGLALGRSCRNAPGAARITAGRKQECLGDYGVREATVYVGTLVASARSIRYTSEGKINISHDDSDLRMWYSVGAMEKERSSFSRKP